uniref:(northern house mosquito) hypothetical protein n=1 Tax=Culex pipiens TaxID=7175 RepID=A0A8D8L2J1_CULPI
MCLHRDRQLRPGHATAGSEQLEAVLRGQDAVHQRLGQAETLYAVGEDVLRERARHRGVSVEADQGDLETVEEEAIAEECGPVHCERDEGGAVQPVTVADGFDEVSARGGRSLSREFDAVGRVHDTPAGRQRERVGGVSGSRRVCALRSHGEAGLLRDGDGLASVGHPEGGQSDGVARGG